MASVCRGVSRGRAKTRAGDTPEGLEVFTDTHPEYGQAIQREAYTAVVHDAHVEIAGVGTEVTFIEFAHELENDGYERQYWLHLYVFCESMRAKPVTIAERHSRITPRFKNKKVCGSLTSTSCQKRFVGNTGYLGGRPCRRIRSDRSPPR